MNYIDIPSIFADEPLDRASEQRADTDWLMAQSKNPQAEFIPLWRGDPLVVNDAPGWLAFAARTEFPAEAPTVLLGLEKGMPRFALDVGVFPTADEAPFADLGTYISLRTAAGILSPHDLALIGHGRWLLDWHRRHRFCACCGAETRMSHGGAKRICHSCGAEHFPRSDPVSIVLAIHDNACLLGRGTQFPPGYYSALAGFVEPCETPEACAVRELKEEAGVDLFDVRYQFSQPWPFPSSMMMGFIGQARSKEIVLDTNEILDAVWINKKDIFNVMQGTSDLDVMVPPRFTIARRLIETWAHS
ncbi:MAG: NAD(+) diphosphatase [Pseudomonadota bacterium]